MLTYTNEHPRAVHYGRLYATFLQTGNQNIGKFGRARRVRSWRLRAHLPQPRVRCQVWKTHQKLNFNASWITRGFTLVLVIVLESGFKRCGKNDVVPPVPDPGEIPLNCA